MSLVSNLYKDASEKIGESLKSFKGGVNVRFNGGGSVGAPPTQVAFNPMLVFAVIGVVIIALFTKKRR